MLLFVGLNRIAVPPTSHFPFFFLALPSLRLPDPDLPGRSRIMRGILNPEFKRDRGPIWTFPRYTYTVMWRKKERYGYV